MISHSQTNKNTLLLKITTSAVGGPKVDQQTTLNNYFGLTSRINRYFKVLF